MVPKWFLKLSFAINGITPVQFMGCATLYAGVLYALGHPYSALVFFFTMITTLGIVGVLKIVTRVKRRPDCLIPLEYKNRAFPSGHVASIAFAATMVPYTAIEVAPLDMYALGVLGLFCTVVVALSRLALKAHTLTQVVAGLLIGTFVPILMIILIDPPLVAWILTAL
jgi:membrane-associated phospholipid phosphatase